MDKIQYIKTKLALPTSGIRAIIHLQGEGSTVPFIARYRKEATGQLDEVQIRNVADAGESYDTLAKRKETILSAVAEQGKLDEKLKAQIESCYDVTTLEDLYLPYKQKRQTRASKARKLGLEPLAKIIMAQRDTSVEQTANQYAKGGITRQEALQGAQDIIAEWVSTHPANRSRLRDVFARYARIDTKKRKTNTPAEEKASAKYQAHYGYSGSLARLSSHRLLAMLRAEREGLMTVKVTIDEGLYLSGLERYYIKSHSTTATYIQQALQDSYKRLLAPSLATEALNAAKSKADEKAIDVFARNLKTLLLAPPLGQQTILAIDPGYRTGCKVVVLSEQGQLVRHTTIYPHPPQKEVAAATASLQQLAHQYQVSAIAIGNGTAGRETEAVTKEALPHINTYFVNEAGASIYSASEVAREEFPDLDLTFRGAVSIGRRLADPLAELIKIDPQSIGVGQYQHDVVQQKLSKKLDQVTIDCVNSVGVNLNTASAPLLRYVSGIGPKLATEIIRHKDNNGRFASKEELMSVKGFGSKTFEQAAGFLRVRGGSQILDQTGIHPERYSLVHKIAKDHQLDMQRLLNDVTLLDTIDWLSYVTAEVGEPTLLDIKEELAKPGLDPRGAAKAFSFDTRLKVFEDVAEGMEVDGIVNNVTDFGAFVDIGIKENGLIHVSQMGAQRNADPTTIVHVGQQVKVQVISVDHQRLRIGLRLVVR